MNPKQRPPSAFRSFRILGKKAQALIQSAQRGTETTKRSARPLPPKDAPLPVRISALNILVLALTVLGVAAGTWLLIVLSDKLIILFLALFLASIIDPGVRMLERKGVPRGLGILLHYAAALVIFLFLVLSLIPIIAAQITDIARYLNATIDGFLANPQITLPLLPAELNLRLTDFLRATLQNLSVDRFADVLQQWGQDLSGIAQGSFAFATKIAGSVFAFVLQMIVVMVLAFFIQLEKEGIRSWLRGFMSDRNRAYMDAKLEGMQEKIAQWARGQLLLGLVVGSLVFVAMAILGMPYALTLGALAAFTEFIPYIGPFIAAVPAVLIALTQGGFLWALVVVAIYYVIQWCENNLLVPLIMKRAVGLSPIAIIFAMLVAISFPEIVHPILGILLAVPVTTILSLFINDLRRND